jgi:hypothetical protein
MARLAVTVLLAIVLLLGTSPLVDDMGVVFALVGATLGFWALPLAGARCRCAGLPPLPHAHPVVRSGEVRSRPRELDGVGRPRAPARPGRFLAI